jgi:hypothetical protein
MAIGITLLLSLSLQSPPAPPELPWMLAAGDVRPLSLPSSIREAALEELEYGPADTIRGVAVPLDRDQVTDYIIQSAPSLCGSGGCVYLIVDGRSGRVLARLLGSTLYFWRERVQGYPIITTYASLSATSSTYTRYIFDRREYRRRSSRTLNASSRDSLLTALNRIPRYTAH